VKVIGGFVLIVIGFLLGLIGERLMDSEISLQAIVVTAVILAYAVLLYVFMWADRKLWPDRSGWVGNLSTSVEPLKGKEAAEWIFNRPQQVGDSFVLSIQKTPFKAVQKLCRSLGYWDYGRARVIDRIQFRSGDYSAGAYPIRWAVTIQGLKEILPDWDKREQTAESFGDNIIIKFNHPEKVTHIVVEILEPRLNQYWAVGDIEIREVRWFKYFGRAIIK